MSWTGARFWRRPCSGFGGQPLVGRRDAVDLLGERQDGAAVAVGHADEAGARLLVERQRAALALRAGDQRLQRIRPQRLERQHLRAGHQRGVELEGRVLGGGADEGDGAVFHHRQEGVLLGAVEAVDLVHEQERAAADGARVAGALEHLLEFRHAGEDRRDLHELELHLRRHQARQRGLAGAGRAPEDQRADLVAAQDAGEPPVRPQKMRLADDFGERLRAQRIGERTRRRLFETGRLEQAHPPSTRLSFLPSRSMMMSQ